METSEGLDVGVSDDQGRLGVPLPEQVEIRRSKRRKRSVSARVEVDRVVVLMPAGLSPGAEQRHVDDLLSQLKRREKRKRLAHDDLTTRAGAISRQYLEGKAEPQSIRWVTNQSQRWGSCTPSTQEIRLSSTMEGMPAWVVDAVIAHELTHLLVAGHGPDFYDWVRRFPRYDEAQAFLSGVTWARRHPE